MVWCPSTRQSPISRVRWVARCRSFFLSRRTGAGACGARTARGIPRRGCGGSRGAATGTLCCARWPKACALHRSARAPALSVALARSAPATDNRRFAAGGSMASSADSAFTGSVAQFYERYMVPLIFEPYAVDLAQRVAKAAPRRVLELAAGTGVVTRQLSDMLDRSCEIVATDLNPAMSEEAARIGTVRPVQWRQADAMQLPFDSASFDVVVCQFGAMFFPD